MNLIEGIKLSNLCDYSFGDQASEVFKTPNRFLKPANINNIEFLDKVKEISQSRDYMTLFIDNIRLYYRDFSKSIDRYWLESLMKENNLLQLCSKIDMKFIIFTNLEDMPIDNFIENQIPNNVLSINAVNALFHNDKIIPTPLGLQRQLNENDHNLSIIRSMIPYHRQKPNKLLYINHNIQNNMTERQGINELFIEKKKWSTVRQNRISYINFLLDILNHKFIICPIGNGIDCHRYWETLYLRRVPIMKKHPYLEILLKDLPVLFVEKYSDVTEKLLLDNDHLFSKLQNLSLESLDLDIMFSNRIQRALI
jgi:hypothetical protein